VLAQATGNIVGELRTAAPADERRKQLLCGAGSLRAATLGLVDQLLVITRGPEVPRGEAQQLTAALAFGQPSEDLRARLRVAVFGLPYQDGIVCKLLIRTHCCIPPRNPGSARCAVTSCCQLDGLELRKGFISVAERGRFRSEEHTSELQLQSNVVWRLLLEKKNYESFDALRSDVEEFLQ